MMKSQRPLNGLGIWLMHELDCRDIRCKEFAGIIQTTPQNLSDILRGNRFSTSTLQRWKGRFEDALAAIDEERGIDNTLKTVYQAICTTITMEGGSYMVYGMQMLSGQTGDYRIADEIQDITLRADRIMQMVELFNREKVEAVHFRDVVLDSL